MVERRVLSLRNNGTFPNGQPPETAADTIARLEQQLNALRAEVKTLRQRVADPARQGITNQVEFASTLRTTLESPDGRNGVVVRVLAESWREVVDTHGDEAAEHLCQHIGRWLVSHIRATDFVGRVGTSSFAIYLGFAQPEGASKKLAKLTRKIEAAPCCWQSESLPVTLSFAVHDLSASSEKQTADDLSQP